MIEIRSTLAFASVVGLFSLFTASVSADAPLRVRWDCYLEADAIECAALANAYAESTPGVVLAADEVELVVHVRSIEVSPRRRYLVEVQTTAPSPSHLSLAREIATSRGEDQTLLDVLALLHRGTLPFLDVSAPGRIEDGALTLRREPRRADPPRTLRPRGGSCDPRSPASSCARAFASTASAAVSS